MRLHLIALASLLWAAGSSASACMGPADLELDDVRFADMVVVGRILGYQLIADPTIRRELKPMFGHRPGWEKGPFLPDYARFEIVVDEVLLGTAGKHITATWNNSTFPEPESMAPGPYLIALRRADSAAPPLRGPSAFMPSNMEPAHLTVLQAPCSVPFLFDSGSEDASAVRRILKAIPLPGRGS